MNAQNKSCLLIDDDSEDQEIFVTAVREINSTTKCRVVSDAENALKLLKQTSELPDLIFLDINMPKMDGFEFLVHIKRDQRLSNIPVIFYSTTKDESQISKATKLGASAFISKTSDYKSLCEILQHFLKDGSTGSSQRFIFSL
jgi:CheY-like chemotaxis protein